MANAKAGAPGRFCARYNAIDLNDNGINGGELNSFTFGVNWFWTANVASAVELRLHRPRSSEDRCRRRYQCVGHSLWLRLLNVRAHRCDHAFRSEETDEIDLFTALFSFSRDVLADDCCDCTCNHCGCPAHCHKVCHVVCEMKDVKVTCYCCRQEDICIPG